MSYIRLRSWIPSLLFVYLGCVDPVEPEFNYIVGLPYIDAVVGTTPGSSYVTVAESAREFGVNLNKPIAGATVYLTNTGNGNSLALTEVEGTYLPPDGFAAKEGETWELRVVLPDGKEYRSRPEKILPAVPIENLEVKFDPELIFSDEFDAYVPGHRISVDIQDPAGSANYYYWRFRSFERLVNCKVCYDQTVFREGICKIINRTSDNITLKDYYTYACEERCFQIRYSDKISIFSDEFTNGTLISKLPVADILLFTKRNILVELQQFSLTPEAYRYYKTLKDLIDNNSGFNAPLPAALVGNLYNPADDEEIVLGRFTAASTRVTPVFIERVAVESEPLESIVKSQAEGEEVPPPIVITAPCIEGRYRTSKQPEAWQDL